jgi:hypothetical protein
MNTKMKVLALALLGLVGYAGSAAAGCPASPVPPWSAVDALGGSATIVAGGYAGTACRLDSALTGDNTSFATVEDDTPAAEPRYRAAFIINTDNVAAMSNVTGVFVFSATSGAGGTPPVSLSIVGDGANHVFLSYAVANSPSTLVGSSQLAAGPNNVEFDYDNGTAAGSPGPHFSIWINNNVSGTPTFTSPISSTGVVDSAFLGLAGATSDYFTGFNGTTVGFDQFDSRRSTFIGF